MPETELGVGLGLDFRFKFRVTWPAVAQVRVTVEAQPRSGALASYPI